LYFSLLKVFGKCPTKTCDGGGDHATDGKAS